MQVKLGKILSQRIKYVGKCQNCEAELTAEPNEVRTFSSYGDSTSSPGVQFVICPQCEASVYVSRK